MGCISHNLNYLSSKKFNFKLQIELIVDEPKENVSLILNFSVNGVYSLTYFEVLDPQNYV